MIKDLNKLLTIEDFEKETIYSVIGRMEVMMDIFKSDPKYKNLIDFHEVYYLVTKRVADVRFIKRKTFVDPEAIDRFDIVFASLYFKPLKEFLQTGKMPTPWRTYFEYSKKAHTNHFVQMLLGINAHINTDLITALKITNFRNKKDYFLIDEVLTVVIPEIMMFLCVNQHDIFGLSGVMFKDYFTKEFHKTVEKWRKSAWNVAHELSQEEYRLKYKEICENTEAFGEKIIESFSNIMHAKHVGLSIEMLHSY